MRRRGAVMFSYFKCVNRHEGEDDARGSRVHGAPRWTAVTASPIARHAGYPAAHGELAGSRDSPPASARTGQGLPQLPEIPSVHHTYKS